MRLPYLVVAAPLLALSLASVARATTYTFTDLDVPGIPFGINDSGLVVGSAYIYNIATGDTITLNAPGAGINNLGQVVGTSYQLNSINTNIFVRNADGTVDTLANSGQAVAAGINNSRQIVGTNTISHTETGFLRDPTTGTYSTLVDGKTGLITNNTSAEGINDAGLVVGYSVGRGFIYNPASATFVNFSYPGALATYAYGINNSGQVVGNYAYSLNSPIPPFSATASFVLDQATGTFTSLSDPAGVSTFARAINDAGDIVGYYTDANMNVRPFLAVPQATPVPEPASLALLAAALAFAGVTAGLSGRHSSLMS